MRTLCVCWTLLLVFDDDFYARVRTFDTQAECETARIIETQKAVQETDDELLFACIED